MKIIAKFDNDKAAEFIENFLNENKIFKTKNTQVVSVTYNLNGLISWNDSSPEHILIKFRADLNDFKSPNYFHLKISLTDSKKTPYIQPTKDLDWSEAYTYLIKRTSLFINYISSELFGDETFNKDRIYDSEIISRMVDFIHIFDHVEYQIFEKYSLALSRKLWEKDDKLYKEEMNQREVDECDDEPQTEDNECACLQNPCICSDPERRYNL